MLPFPTDKIFEIKTDEEFNNLSLEVFRFQYANNEIYKAFINGIGVNPDKIDHFKFIPFLPIDFFKTQKVLSAPSQGQSTVFTSSSTTSQIPSKHIVTDISIYEKSFIKGFELFYGKPDDYVILALLPSYLERDGSSLVYMFNKLIQLSKSEWSGFYLNNYSELIKTIQQLNAQSKKVLLIGVSYALLDLAEMGVTLNENFIVMETGGMKGRRKEMLKEELHSELKKKFSVSTIHSEYGMTELLSQAYSKGNGIFETPTWMKVLIRDIEDPLSLLSDNKTGGINVVDLANINSCSFISTYDLGRTSGRVFEVIGRFDNSDVRGCNLMVT